MPSNTLAQLLAKLNSITKFNGFHKSHPIEMDDIVYYTSFLPPNSLLVQRIWHINNGNYTIPTCGCGNKTKWHHVKKAYNPHCSVKCANNNPNKITNIKQSVLTKYGNTSYAQSHIDITALSLLQNKDWLYNQHIILEKSLAQIAMELNINTTTVSNYFKQFNIVVKLFSRSGGERELEKFLTDHSIISNINTKQVIPPYELDIFCPDHNIAIEYCGVYWHSTKHDRITPMYHKRKYDMCKNIDLRLITIFEDEWVHKKELVKRKLLSLLDKETSPKIFARKCTIINIPKSTKIKFFNDYHIQGNGPSSINIGLEYNNDVVACMAFIKQKDGTFVLNRYATSTPVIGGFSKLLSHFKKTNDWTEIVSFADLRWSQGGVYEKNGFVLDKTLPPDYDYVDAKNILRIHKSNFRHKHLTRLFGDNYDSSLSETQNTINNGWYKIYNCGLLRYVIKN